MNWGKVTFDSCAQWLSRDSEGTARGIRRECGLETHTNSHYINPGPDPALLPVSHTGCASENLCSLVHISTSFYLHITQDPGGATLSFQVARNSFVSAIALLFHGALG